LETGVLNVIALVQPSEVPPDPANWPIYLIVAGCAGALGWGIEYFRKLKEIGKYKIQIRQLEADIGKLTQEEIKLAGDHLKELQRSRDAYSQACGTCSACANDLISKMQSEVEPAQIYSNREQLSDIVSGEVIRTLCSFVEWQGLGRKNEPDDLLSYIRNDVCPEILRISNWVAIVNNQEFVDEQGQHPLRIEERSVRPIREVIRHLPQHRIDEVRETLFSSLDELLG